MFIDRDVRLLVSPIKYENDAYDIANLFYRGSVLRPRGCAETGGAANDGVVNDSEKIIGGADTVCAENAATDVINISVTGDSLRIGAVFYDPQSGVYRESSEFTLHGNKNAAYSLKISLYGVLKARAARVLKKDIKLPWGALVGIRPVKIYSDHIGGGAGKSEIIAEMKRAYDVPEKSSELCLKIAAVQREIIERYDSRVDYMLYIGIPFCVTKCAYCSFPSDAHNKADRYAAPYIDALIKELNCVAGLMKGAGKRLRAVYIGGGTPTALAAGELDRLLSGFFDAFNGEYPDELTVEAGRADTIDREKLAAIRGAANRAGKLRLCVNPQTMNVRTLELIGRSHTPEDVSRAYRLARESGFNDINMDIIAGLPGENAADFERTLDAVFGLGPDGVTSHTLCIKRSSRFNESEGAYAYPDAGETESMQEAAFRRAASCGMRPYYLYRQKNTIGALANTGYARRGCECAYNIHEMADRIDVLAAGAGAVSKFVYPDGGRIERVFNVKNLLEYISRIDEMIRRKTVFFAASAMFSVEWK